MPVPTDQLAEDLKSLTETVIGLKVGSAKFHASVEVRLAVIPWVGIFFASLLIPLVGAALTIAWNASSIVSEVRQQGGRLEKIEQQLIQVVQRMDKNGQSKNTAQPAPRKESEPDPVLGSRSGPSRGGRSMPLG